MQRKQTEAQLSLGSAAGKVCFICGEWKPIDEFYAHPQMADGHLNKCKECTKQYITEQRRGEARERILQYDRERAKTPERKELSRAVNAAYYKEHPDRRMAKMAVHEAIRRGQLVPPATCSACGERGNIHAHHEDYSKPLEVEWLCEHCHRTLRHRTR